MKNLFHTFIRWALGIHGAIHVIETIVNLLEGAYYSAALSLFSGFIMLAGAYIDSTHHNKDNSDLNIY